MPVNGLEADPAFTILRLLEAEAVALELFLLLAVAPEETIRFPLFAPRVEGLTGIVLKQREKVLIVLFPSRFLIL